MQSGCCKEWVADKYQRMEKGLHLFLRYSKYLLT